MGDRQFTVTTPISHGGVRHGAFSQISRCAALGVLILIVASKMALSQHVHNQSPINYTDATAHNCITRLQAQIDAGKQTLQHDERSGYLRDVLKALQVPVSSQALVFSKTSLQLDKISPMRPRAIYFNDDVYVGWVQKSNLMEFSAVDPKLGAVFYTLKHTKTEKPQFNRHRGSCLACHATRHTGYVPGHVVFSVYSDSLGSPIASAGFSSTDHTSPFRQRWGGWYVTGQHGEQRHRGNSTMRYVDTADRFNFERGANRADLSGLVDVKPYLSPHSDLIALMVMEHQAMVHNRITAASYHGQIVGERAKAENTPSNDKARRLAQQRLDLAVQRLVDSLLLAREAELDEPIQGTSNFAKEFAARGPSDSKGRSLRELDLKNRMFKYPCSYLIYSEAFERIAKIGSPSGLLRALAGPLKYGNKLQAPKSVDPDSRDHYRDLARDQG